MSGKEGQQGPVHSGRALTQHEAHSAAAAVGDAPDRQPARNLCQCEDRHDLRGTGPDEVCIYMYVC